MLNKLHLALYLLLHLGFQQSGLSQTKHTDNRRILFFASLPTINSYYLTIDDNAHKNTSFLGLGSGVGYYYKDNNYLDLQIGATVSNGVPLPVGVDHFGPYDSYFSAFIDISQNQVVQNFLKNRLTYNYGVGYVHYNYVKWYESPVIPDSTQLVSYSHSKNTLGLNCGLHFRVFPHWSIGFRYNSSVYNFIESKWQYNHIGFLELVFRFGTKRD